MRDLRNAEAIQAWSSVPAELIEQFGESGDTTRQYLLNPALWHLLGEVGGLRILDAGCGQGYLSRLLAQRGALVTGLEPAQPWYAYALQRERDAPLGVRYLAEDLSYWDAEVEAFSVVLGLCDV